MEGIRRAPAELRLAQREALRAKNEPPRLSMGEEVFNAISHGVGTGLSIAGFVFLLILFLWHQHDRHDALKLHLPCNAFRLANQTGLSPV